MQNHLDDLIPSEKLKNVEDGCGGLNHYGDEEEGADKDDPQHASIWTMCSRQPTSSATSRGD